MQLAKNAIVAGRFRLNHLIGRGGMGSVWHATHLGLDVPCAIKFIEGDRANRAESATRFEREAKAAAHLRGRNVVQIFDHGICEGTPYIAMELLEGEDLGKRLDRMKRLPPREVVTIVSDVARALRKAHAAGIVHRDLKPENIFLVQEDDDREIAKVLDFGIAKVTTNEPSARTRTGELLGTPHYMSPEQAQGNREVDARSDLWSLAVITFECLTGVRPFESDGLGDLLLKIFTAPVPVPSTMADLPQGFDAWWERAIERAPAARFQSANAFVESLAIALAVDLDAVRGYSGVNSARGGRSSDPDLPDLLSRDVRATAPTALAEIDRDLRKTDPAPPDYESTDRVTMPYIEGLALANGHPHEAGTLRSGTMELAANPSAAASGGGFARKGDAKTTDRDLVIDLDEVTQKPGNTNDGTSMSTVRPAGLPTRRPLLLAFLAFLAAAVGIAVFVSWDKDKSPGTLDGSATDAGALTTISDDGAVTAFGGSNDAAIVETATPDAAREEPRSPPRPRVSVATGVTYASGIANQVVDRVVRQAVLQACSKDWPAQSPREVNGTLSLSISGSEFVDDAAVDFDNVSAQDFVDCVHGRLIGKAVHTSIEPAGAKAIVTLTVKRD